MKKVLAVSIATILLVSGCGFFDRVGASLTGVSESCHSGVVYLQFSSGVTVKYLPDGKIATCN